MATFAPMDVSVASLVNRYGGGLQQLPVRHGAAERGRHRNRSRDRVSARTAPPRGSTVHRATPAGDEERADWLAALESFDNRISTVERHCRMHGQSMAMMEEAARTHRTVTQEAVGDVANYKAYVDRTFQEMNEKFMLRVTTIDNSIKIGINESLNALAEKVQSLNVSYESMVTFIHSTGQQEYKQQLSLPAPSREPNFPTCSPK